MKTKVLKYNLAGRSQVFVVSLLALLRKTGLAGEETSGAIPAEVLDTLKIQLVSPNVTGAQILTTKLTRPCHYSVEGNELTIALGELTPGQHRLTVKSVYGTNTRSLLIIDATVPVGAGETGEAISVDVAAVSTVSDENNADGRVFQSDEEGNARINANTLSIGGGTATGEGAVAEGNGTKAIGKSSHAEGSASWGNPYKVTVRPLTAQEKEEIAAKVGNVHPDYICENDEIEDGQAPVLYADEECTEEVARIKWSKYSEIWLDGYEADFFQIVEGTLAAGTYWARFEPVASGNQSHAEGNSTTASGNQSHAEGENTTASGNQSHAEGENTTASGDASHAEGDGTTASGNASHAEGDGTTASGNASHAEGENTTASGDYSHAEGYNTTASGNQSHAEGNGTTASGNQSHAEGENTTASGDQSHAEGDGTTASGNQSHAEGDGTTASGDQSHAEGDGTTASGNASHAEGENTTASGDYSHAEGEGTIAVTNNQHVSGKYNIEDSNGDYAFIVGNGQNSENRSNAFAIDWNGNLVLFNNGTPVLLTPAKLAQLIA